MQEALGLVSSTRNNSSSHLSAPTRKRWSQENVAELEKGQMASRVCVDHLEHLDPQGPRGTEEHLGSLALLVVVVTQASGLLALL